MQKHRVRVVVTLKNGVLDPQGLAIKHVIDAQGKRGFEEVRQGKVFDLVLASETPAGAIEAAQEAARTVLSNPILETFACTLVQ